MGEERLTDGGAPPVRLRSFSSSLPMMLLRAREAIMRHFRALLRQHEVTEQQWRVLRALSSIDAIETSRLAQKVYLLPPSLSRILRDLDERGLIVRRPDAIDMRVGLITISPAGRALIDAISPQSESIYAEITLRFGVDNLHTLQSLLLTLETCMTEDGSGDAAPP